MPVSSSDRNRNELYRPVKGHRQAVTLHQAAGDNTGEGVAGAGVMGRDIVALDLPDTAVGAVIGIDKGLFFAV